MRIHPKCEISGPRVGRRNVWVVALTMLGAALGCAVVTPAAMAGTPTRLDPTFGRGGMVRAPRGTRIIGLVRRKADVLVALVRVASDGAYARGFALRSLDARGTLGSIKPISLASTFDRCQTGLTETFDGGILVVTTGVGARGCPSIALYDRQLRLRLVRRLPQHMTVTSGGATWHVVTGISDEVGGVAPFAAATLSGGTVLTAYRVREDGSGRDIGLVRLRRDGTVDRQFGRDGVIPAGMFKGPLPSHESFRWAIDRPVVREVSRNRFLVQFCDEYDAVSTTSGECGQAQLVTTKGASRALAAMPTDIHWNGSRGITAAWAGVPAFRKLAYPFRIDQRWTRAVASASYCAAGTSVDVASDGMALLLCQQDEAASLGAVDSSGHALPTVVSRGQTPGIPTSRPALASVVRWSPDGRDAIEVCDFGGEMRAYIVR